jgi:polyisoprenoid-binding protein YceI
MPPQDPALHDAQSAQSAQGAQGAQTDQHAPEVQDVPEVAQPKRVRGMFSRKHWRRWVLGLAAAGAVAYVAIPWLYIHVFSEPAPPPLSFEQLDKDRAASASSIAATSESRTSESPPASATANPAIDGAWTVTAPSSAGYRVQEVIAGQDKTAVGRTSTVDGSFTITNGQVTAAEVNVDLASMASDEAQRDEQFRERIMSTDQFPVATFTLTEGFALPSTTGIEGIKVQGTLSLRGVEKPATFTISGKTEGNGLSIVASTDINFADYQIPNPSIGPVSTDDHGTIEVALSAKR